MRGPTRTPAREQVQAQADRATYTRRAQAVEQERAIAENEMQNKIELARREQQLVEKHGANSRRQVELEAAAQLAAAQGQAERDRVAAAAKAEQDRLLAEAQANSVRTVGLAEAEKESARVGVYRELPQPVLNALTVKEFAGQLPDIQALTITPDVLVRVRGAELTHLLPKVAVGTAAIESRTMVQATLDDGQRLTGLNEVFIGHFSHQSAR
ncbi:MAG TPA: hypothetical protein VFC19_07035 [Candidatus Limnocylindrales bacterium]|nr:hypothetical protein [Candidatus Limnocylindrales bacterium]